MPKKQSLWLFTMLCGVALWASCTAKNVVTRVQNGSLPKREGVFYALPRTVVGVTTTVVKVEKTAGKYQNYAACFFPEETAIPRDKISFTFGDSMVGSRAEPDPDEIFMVKIKGHWLEDKNADLSFSSGGVLTKAKAETTNRTLDVVLQAAQTATSLASQAGIFAPIFREEETHSRKFRSVRVSAETDPVLQELRALREFLQSREGKSGCGDAVKSELFALNALVEDANKRQAEEKMLRDTRQLFEDEQEALRDLQSQTDAIRKLGGRKDIKQQNDLALKQKEKEKAVKDLKDSLQKQEKDVADLLSKQTDSADHFTVKFSDLLDAYRTYVKIQSLQEESEQFVRDQSGQISAQTLELKLGEMAKLIKKYKNDFFLGNTSKTPTALTFEYIPEKPVKPDQRGSKYTLAQAGEQWSFPLFKFSPQRGVCEILVKDQGPQDTSMAYHSIKVCPDGNPKCEPSEKVEVPCNASEMEIVSLKLEVMDGLAGRIHQGTTTSEKEDRERGFYYRIPAITQAKVLYGNAELDRFRLPIAQLGLTTSLPASTGGRTTNYTVSLNGETGALENFILGSKGLLEQSTVTGAGALAKTVLDAKDREAAKQAAAAAASSENAQAEGMAQLLEICARIKKAQDSLGGPVVLPKVCVLSPK